MPGTPAEYSIVYRMTNQGNTGTSGSLYLTRDNFWIAGGTGVGLTIGRITRMECKHFHTCTYYSNWSMVCGLVCGSKTFTSDTANVRITMGNWFYNYFGGTMPTPEEFNGWGALTINAWRTAGSSSANLYWRANSENPIDLTVYFYDARDLVDGASPPTVDGVTITDSTGYMGKFGNCVQNRSSLTIVGKYQLDPEYRYLSANHTLTLRSGSTTIYTSTKTDDATFSVGTIRVSGEVTWTYNVLDTAGNSVTKTGTFTVLGYSPPTITGYSVDRYAIGIDDEGQPTYQAANDGNHVWISLRANVTGVAGKNAWNLTITYGSGTTGVGGTSKVITSGGDAANLSYTQDRAVVTEEVNPSSDWWFRLRITDSFTYAETTVLVGHGISLLNIEEYGVGIGMYTDGTRTSKRFQVADDYESIFNGGIRGVTNGSSTEVLTGGRWVDGKPIYRLCGQINLDQVMTHDTCITDKITTANVSSVISFHASWRDASGNIRINTFSWGGGTSQDFAITQKGLVCCLVTDAISPGLFDYEIEYTKK